jgi:molybdopterin converting factor small subunit
VKFVARCVPNFKKFMRIKINFYSYFKGLTGCAETFEELPDESTIAELNARLIAKFPKLASMQKSTLIAVGIEYQNKDYILKSGDEVSLFPPVQGG